MKKCRKIKCFKKEKVSTIYLLVFYEDRIIVPKNLRTTVISLHHKRHLILNRMTMTARHFWWPRVTEVIQKKCESCVSFKVYGKNIKPNVPSTEKISYQLEFTCPITAKNQKFYIILSMDRLTKSPATSFCKTTDGQTAVRFLEQYTNQNGVPKTIRTDKATAFTGQKFKEFCKNHQI